MRKLRMAVWMLAAPALGQAATLPRTNPEVTYWTPDAALIARIESKLNPAASSGMPLATKYRLEQYDRYYYGISIDGRRQVRGVLLVPPNREDNPKTGAYITEERYVPRVIGGGCANLTVIYNVARDSVSTGACRGPEGSAPPSETPRWTPDAATAARMEEAIRDYMRRALPDRPDLGTHDREYWGVTLGGKPMIRGNVIGFDAVSGRVGQLLLGTEPQGGVADGFCNNIRLVYDPTAGRLTQFSCDTVGQLPAPLP